MRMPSKVRAFIDFMVEKRVKLEIDDMCQNIGKKNGAIVRIRLFIINLLKV